MSALNGTLAKLRSSAPIQSINKFMVSPWGIAVIGNNLSVCKDAKVPAKAMIYNDVKEEK